MSRNTARFLISSGVVVVAAVAVVTGFVMSPNNDSLNRGQTVYDEYCLRCHGAEGAGGDGLVTVQGRAVLKDDPQKLISTLLYGASGSVDRHGTAARASMPPIPYNDKDVAAVATFVLQRIAGRSIVIREEDVSRVRSRR
ncbi:MAG TPA: cytochrome c [Chlorobiota bacterium]|nr:cytochrome c [Chlorobiota bacterium]